MPDNGKLHFESDYMKGAHPRIIERLVRTNMDSSQGYGLDEVSESARARIRKACGCPDAAVEFLIGGTQTNAVIIDAFLRSYQGVIAAETGHISVHEAGAIEAGGHKVLTLPQHFGKLSPDEVRRYIEAFRNDENKDHMVMPGMIYISHPTEYGTLYTRAELAEFRKLCDSFGMRLYLDGARLAYALACPVNDVTLSDLAQYCDAFYIGGTKCGALFGEAVVVPDPEALPHLFTMIKQHGALLAKGRILGIQYDELFRDNLYMNIGKPAIIAADRIRKALKDKGYTIHFGSPTNQVFCEMDELRLSEFEKHVEYSFWERNGDNTIIRLATDWGTKDEEVDALISVL